MSTELIADLGLGHVRIAPEHMQAVPGLGTEYGPAEGWPLLRQAIGAWEEIPAEEVALTTGASMGLVATLATLERPCSVLCPRPYYPAYPKALGMLGLRAIYYDLEEKSGWRPDPQRISHLIGTDTRAIVWNFPHNPTGSLADSLLLEEMSELVGAAKLVVISDEVYADFIYNANSFPDVRQIFGRTCVVRLRSFSKLLGIPGERLGYVVAEPSRLKTISQAHWALAMSPPATAQGIALSALHTQLDHRAQELRRLLRENLAVVLQILASYDRIGHTAPAAGVFCWLKVRDCLVDSRTLAHACATHARVVVAPGAAFGIDSPIYLRASFAVPMDEASRGFEALAAFLQQF